MNWLEFERNLLFRCTSRDQDFRKFITEAGRSLFSEISKFSQHNEDPTVLEYVNEGTLASLLVNGLIRKRKKDVTALQEYSCSDEEGRNWGRPDIYLKFGDLSFWIECKFFRTLNRVPETHWNIKEWLKWDNLIFNQVQTYYDRDRGTVINKKYIVTMVFNVLQLDHQEHRANAEEKMDEMEKYGERDWYYVYNHQKGKTNGKWYGMEIYGTFINVFDNTLEVGKICAPSFAVG